jgi:ubiquinone/menaquinone biosynthesis C-methylase UbiE
MSEKTLTEEYVKDYYDKSLKTLDENYTKRRWFSSVEAEFDYNQTKYAFLHAVGKDTYARGLEVGPGDGVWTRIIAPQITSYEILDQSEEMLKRARETLSDVPHITYTAANFAEHTPPKGVYDVIISVRCFEYFADKATALRKFYEALAPGGRFVLITKNRGYKTASNWNRSLLHTEQIGKHELIKELRQAGFVVDATYPAVMRWKSKYAFLRGIFWLLHRIAVLTNGRVYVPYLTDMSTESYTFVVHKEKVVVELYGLSGGGKSTLSKELAKEDPAVTIIKPQPRGIGLVYFIVHNPTTFFFWMKEFFVSVIFYKNWKLLRHRLSILLSTFEALGVGQRIKKGIVVHDEGLFQRVFSIYEEDRTPEQMASLLKEIPPVDLLLIVDRTGNHFERFRPDADNPRASMGESYMATWREMILRNHENLQQAFALAGIPTRHITKEHTPEQILHMVRSL